MLEDLPKFRMSFCALAGIALAVGSQNVGFGLALSFALLAMIPR